MANPPTLSVPEIVPPVIDAHNALLVALIGCAEPLLDPKTRKGACVETCKPVTIANAIKPIRNSATLLAQYFDRIRSVCLNRHCCACGAVNAKEHRWTLCF